MSKRVKRNDADRKFQEGIHKHFKAGKALSFAGNDYKPAELDKIFGANAVLWEGYEAARVAAHQALLKAEASESKTAPVRNAFRAFIVATFGDASPKLADFGVEGRKQRRRLSAEAKALAVIKLRATREARGTLGKRKKEKIVGKLPPELTPGGAPTTPSTPTNGASGGGGGASALKVLATA